MTEPANVSVLGKIPPAAGPRALLKARIAQLSATEPNWRSEWFMISRAGMVCDGSLGLTEAEREIASNWIAAYKKYPHTDHPLAER